MPGVAVAVAVAVSVGVLVAVFVGVSVGVFVAVLVGVAVGVLVGVFVGVLVGVFVGVSVGVLVAVLVGVLVGVGVRPLQAPLTQTWSDWQQALAPQGVVLASHAQRPRPVAVRMQSFEQHSVGLRQIVPLERHVAAASPEPSSPIAATVPPPSASPSARSTPRRDRIPASCLVKLSNREPSIPSPSVPSRVYGPSNDVIVHQLGTCRRATR